jgi:hypothetical protein
MFVMHKIITRTAKFCCCSRTTQVVASTVATQLSSSRLVLLWCAFSLDCCMPYLSSHIFMFAMVTYTSFSYYVPKQEKIQFKTITIQRIRIHCLIMHGRNLNTQFDWNWHFFYIRKRHATFYVLSHNYIIFNAVEVHWLKIYWYLVRPNIVRIMNFEVNFHTTKHEESASQL